MDAQRDSTQPVDTKGPPSPRGRLEKLDVAVAARIVAAGSDVAMLIDADGVIRDMALGNDDMIKDGAATWLDKRWSDTVTVESRHKVEELLRDALRDGQTHWREVNQVTPRVNSMMMRFLALDAGGEGHVIALGRDDRATVSIHQRLMEAQQITERDYSRLRDAESRYRLLFQVSSEGAIVVDLATRRIIDANPAAERLVGDGAAKLIGEAFVKLFDEDSQDGAATLLTVAQTTAQSEASQARLTRKGREFLVSAALFRQDRAARCLMRIMPVEQAPAPDAGATARLEALVERMPDAFVITDSASRILYSNAAFLDLARIATAEQAIGQSLSQFLGRVGLDRNILIDNVRDHGFVRNFGSVLGARPGEQEDVEVSAVAIPGGAGTAFGFTIRSVRLRQREPARNAPELRHSVEQLTQLVGRAKLKDLVRETTDLVERLCIEAALELTKGNRASAADLVGHNRRCLYAPLHVFGLGNLGDKDT